jgi:hypothetical protein
MRFLALSSVLSTPWLSPPLHDHRTLPLSSFLPISSLYCSLPFLPPSSSVVWYVYARVFASSLPKPPQKRVTIAEGGRDRRWDVEYEWSDGVRGRRGSVRTGSEAE